MTVSVCYLPYATQINDIVTRAVTRDFHELLGNFLATSRIASDFFYSEQFL